MSKKYRREEILKMDNLFNIVDLPEDKRTGVMKIVNPIDWFVVRFDLAEYAGQTVTVKFSADVKREGASGTLKWQINNKNYPAVGNTVYGAKIDIWHRFRGEWTGTLTDSQPVIYLNTWKNDSERTTFFIDNITLEVIKKEAK